MDIIKKTVLQGFSISVLALAMVACGGSSDDSAPAATPTTPASLTTATDVAKAVAGIEAAKTIFDVVVSDGKDGIEEVIREGRAGKDINCGTSPNAGKFKVITNTGTAYSNDGTGVNETCLESGHKWLMAFPMLLLMSFMKRLCKAVPPVEKFQVPVVVVL